MNTFAVTGFAMRFCRTILPRKFALLYVLCNGLALPLFSQSGSYKKFAHYNSLNGLPQNEINFLTEDHNQYLWLATQNGLARFDGRYFLLFNKSRFPELLSNRIANLYNTDNGVEVRSIENQKQWFKVSNSSNNILPVPIDSTAFLITNRTAKLNIANLFDNRDGLLDTSLFTDIKKESAIRFQLVPGSDKDLGFILHNGWIYHYRSGRAKQLTRLNTIKSAWVIHGNLYICNINESIDLFGPDGSRKKINDRDFSRFLLNGMVYFSENYALIKFENKLYYIENNNNKPSFKLLINDLEGINLNTVFYQPEKAMIYLGTSDDGFFVFRNTCFQNYFRTADRGNDHTLTNVFYAIAALPNNAVMTSNGVFDSTGKFQKFPLSDNIFSLIPDDQNNIYFEKNNKLFSRDIITGKTIFIDTLDIELRGADKSEEGDLYYADKNQVKIRTANATQILLKTNPDNEVGWIKKAGKDELWIAWKNSLEIFHLSAKKRTVIPLFNNKQVRAFLKDENGNIWLGTYGDGWYLYKNNVFVTLPVDRLGYLNIVNGILEDKLGFIWVSTNNGLFRFLINDLVALKNGDHIPFYNHYNSSYGFASEEFNGGCTPSALRLNNNLLVFPSLRGLVVFNPVQVKPEESDLPVFIDYVREDGRFLKGDSVWRIRAGTGQIAIATSSPYFGNSYNLQIEYSFVGSEKNWVFLPEDGRIRLVKLGHGTYTIIIRRPRGFGDKGYIYKTITLIVEPFWYETRAFYIMLMLVALILGFVFFRVRNRRLLEQQTALKEEVRLRTLEIGEQNIELKDRITEILKNREALQASNLLNDRLMASLAHDIRSPLKFQLKASEILVKILKNNQEPDIVRIAEEIELNTAGMYHFTGDILAWYLSVNEKQKMDPEPVNLREVVNKCIGFLKYSASMNSNTFINNIPEDSDVETIKPIIEIVVRNLLDNSNKNARNGTISVDMLRENMNCGIVITDNGNGMRPEETESMNMFYKMEMEAAMPGFGSYMLRDFIQFLGAEIHYRSTEGVGTSVSLICFKN